MMLVASGALVVIGLVLVVAGTQLVLEGVSQGGGTVGPDSPLVVESHLVPGTAGGVFAVQVMGPWDGRLDARVLDPYGTEIASHVVDSEMAEAGFEVTAEGNYTLIVEGDAGVQVFGAIGPLPDAGKKSVGFISSYVLIVGVIGMAVSVVYGIRKGGQFR